MTSPLPVPVASSAVEKRLPASGRWPFHLVVATIASRLNAILPIAEDITVEALNAKALIVRTGDAVRAFRPITDYMDELARETIRLVRAVNGEALAALTAAVDEIRAEARLEALEQAIATGQSTPPALAALSVMREEAEQAHRTLLAGRRRRYTTLVCLLVDIEGRMKAARIIAGTSRIEAAGAGQHQANVAAVADTLERAAKGIQARIDECRRMLRLVQA